jgi:proline dehydrogenase
VRIDMESSTCTECSFAVLYSLCEGYANVRVYVPYGTECYPCYMRRLAERPANVWFILSNLLRRRSKEI